MTPSTLFRLPFLVAVCTVVTSSAFSNHVPTVLPVPAVQSAKDFNLTSGPVSFKVSISQEAGLVYQVAYSGQVVSNTSPLGLVIGDKTDLSTQIKTIVQQEAKDSSNATFLIQRQDGSHYFLDVKTFSNGLALRYRIPSQTSLSIHKELTTITFPSGTKAWYASGPFQYGWIQSYQERPTDNIKDQLLAPPATFLLPTGIYAAVTEANLTHFHGAVLLGEDANKIRFGFVDNKGHVESGIPTGMPAMKYAHAEVRNPVWEAPVNPKTRAVTTPWRVLMLSKDLNGLVNNTIVDQVSDAPDPQLFPQGDQTPWIKPGRASFTWLVQGGASRLSMETYKKYIEGCGQLGLEYLVVDDGWEHWPNKWDNVKELVEYGKKHHVGIWLWRPSSKRFGNASDIGFLDPQERTDFMRKCAELGVKGLKIDFFHTENVYTVQFMEDLLKEAAKNHLLVIFHGVNKPTGDYTTYPNLLAKEAVRGLECVGGETNWAPGPPWPYHDTVLPFTRWLVGSADYTPLNFRNSYSPSVTFAHEFASIYVLTSEMLIFAADMEDMLNTPGRSFIEQVPVSWDETFVLPESKIGELAAIARRSKNTWYLGVLNGEKPCTLSTNLPFLDKQAVYELEILADSPNNRKKIQIRKATFRPGDTLNEPLLAGGGLVVRITKK